MATNQNHTDMPIRPALSIADQVYERTREKILNGTLKPGQRLHELDVAKSAQTSRTPVREAFRRLEQDGLIERTPRGGVRIIHLDWETIKDLYELRAVLETHAIELACQRISSEQIIALKRTKAQAMELLNTEDIKQEDLLSDFLELNTEFHDTIYKSTGSRFLIKIINQLRGVMLAMRSVSLQAERGPHRSWEDHNRLIQHLEKRDAEAARKLIQKHIENAAMEALSVMKKNEPTDGSA